MFGPLNVKRDGLAIVYRAAGLLEAEVVKGRLESADIPVLLDYESAGPTFGLTVAALGEVRVMVPVGQADEARELLAVDQDADEMDDAAFDEE